MLLSLALAAPRCGRASRCGARAGSAAAHCGGVPPPSAAREAGAGVLALGFAGGLASSVLLRGWDAFGTVHGLVASAALASFLATGALGWRLEHGRSRAVEWHARLAALSVLLAAAALGTGFVLLP